VKFFPEHWSSTYNHWLENIQEWCIPRQLWWATRFRPGTTRMENIYVARTEEEAVKKAGGKKLKRDEDVLDTWFLLAAGAVLLARLAGEDEGPGDYLPSSVLVTGFDIISSGSPQIMASLHFTGQVPFRHCLLNALVRDAEGQKMSKSKGTRWIRSTSSTASNSAALVKKSTTGLLLEEHRKKAERYVKSHYPNGIPAFGADALRFTSPRSRISRARSTSTSAAARATATSATSCGTPRASC